MTKDDPQNETEEERLRAIEAQAVDKAKATADAAYRPSPAAFNAPSPAVLLQQVDGPSLKTYDSQESVFVGRSLPVPAGDSVQVPIQVTTPGSLVEYSVELKSHDIVFSITVERDEGVTIVKVRSMELSLLLVLTSLTHSLSFSLDPQEDFKFTFDDAPVTQKFLVGNVPCLIQFRFDNSYSWMREKVISYKVCVKPPSRESLATGRRLRATACLKAVQDDLRQAETMLQKATKNKQQTAAEVQKLMDELAEKQKQLQLAEKDEAWSQERRALRLEQQRLLKLRLEKGWEDEEHL